MHKVKKLLITFLMLVVTLAVLPVTDAFATATLYTNYTGTTNRIIQASCSTNAAWNLAAYGPGMYWFPDPIQTAGLNTYTGSYYMSTHGYAKYGLFKPDGTYGMQRVTYSYNVAGIGTNYLSFRVNGTDVNGTSSSSGHEFGTWLQQTSPATDTNQVAYYGTTGPNNGIQVTATYTLVPGPSGQNDTVDFKYQIYNASAPDGTKVGMRVGVDTMLGPINDGAPIMLEDTQRYVQAGYVDNSGLVSNYTVFRKDAPEGIPAKVQSITSFNNEKGTSPGAPLMSAAIRPISDSYNPLRPNDFPQPDYFELTNWTTANGNISNRTDATWAPSPADATLPAGQWMNSSGATAPIGDSAFALQWNDAPLNQGETVTYEWYYGLGDAVINNKDGLTYTFNVPREDRPTPAGIMPIKAIDINATNSQTAKYGVMMGFAYDPNAIQIVDPNATIYSVNDPILGIPSGTYPPNLTMVAVKNVGDLATTGTTASGGATIYVRGINTTSAPIDTNLSVYIGYTKAVNGPMNTLTDITKTMTIYPIKINSFSGAITDQSSNPVYRAQVALVDAGTSIIKFNTLTDSNGNYNFSGSNISTGTYKVFVSYPPDVGSDTKYMIDPSLPANNGEYEYAYTLSTDAGTQVVVADWTDPSVVVPPGAIKGMLTIPANAMTILPVSATLPADITFNNYNFSNVDGAIKTILGSVSGQVVDSGNNNAGIEGVSVSLVDTLTGQLANITNNTMTTDSNGKFTFANIPVGSYQAYYKLPQFYTFTDITNTTGDSLSYGRLDGGAILVLDPTAATIGAASQKTYGILAVGTDASRQLTADPVHLQKMTNGVINVSIFKDPGAQVYTPALQVTLTDVTTGAVTGPVSLSAGQYSFTNIAPADQYTVSYVLPNDYNQSYFNIQTTQTGNVVTTTTTTTDQSGVEHPQIVFTAADYNGANYVKNAAFKIEQDGNVGYSGYVYENGTTTGISGAQVQLVDSSNNLYLTTLTSVDGSYSFPGIDPQSTYQVYITMPSTYVTYPDTNYQAASTAGNTVALDSANTKNLLGSAPLAPAANRDNSTPGSNGMFYNAYGVRITGTVSGTVFADTNGNGVLDLLKPRVEGATVYLLTTDAVGNYIIENSMVTGPDGKYSFSGLLAAQNYQVAYVLPDGYRFSNSVSIASGSVQGAQWVADSTSLPNSDAKAGVVNTINSASAVITVTATARSFTQNMPLTQVANQISGTVTESSVALANQTVYLLNSQGQIVQTATTNSNGQYTYSGVTVGSYSVAVTKPALDMFDASQSAVNVSGAPSQASLTLAYGMKSGTSVVASTTAVPLPDKYSADVRVAPGISVSEYNLTVDPINMLPSDQLTITGKVVDQNANGVSNVTVALYDPATGNIIATATTDGTGVYTFNNATLTVNNTNLTLAPGTAYGLYYDLANLSSDYSWSSPATYLGAADNGSGQIVAQSGSLTGRMTDPTNRVTVRATVNTATVVELNNTPGGPSGSTLNGTVFLDTAPYNGSLDQGETGLAGVPVYLINGANQTVLQSTTTNASGNYSFAVQAASAAGQYLVYAAPTTGYVYDAATAGGTVAGLTTSPSPGTLDPSGTVGMYWSNQNPIALGGTATIDIPMVRDPSRTISGQVKTPDGVGINGLVSPDVKAYLVDPNPNSSGGYTIVETTSLASDGTYSFSTPPGLYNVFISYGNGYQNAANLNTTGMFSEMRLNATGTSLNVTTPANANGLVKINAVTAANPHAAVIYLQRKANPGSVSITVNYLNQDGTPLAGVTSDIVPAAAFGSQAVTAKYIAGYTLLSADINGNAAVLAANRSVTVNPVRTVGDTVNFYYGQVGYITVKHQVSGTGQLLLSETIPGIVGAQGAGVSRDFAGYQLVGTVTTQTATFAPGDSQTVASTIVFEYTAVDPSVNVIRGNVVVKHVDASNPNNILAIEQYQGAAGDSVIVSSKQFAGWTLAAGQPQTQTAVLTSPAVTEVVFEYTADNNNGGDDAIIDTRNQNGYAQISDLVDNSNGLLLGQRLEVYPMAVGQTSMANEQLNANDYTGYTAKAPTTQNVTITVRETLPVEFYYGVNVTIQYEDENGQPVPTGNGTGTLNNQTPGDPIDYTQITPPDGYEVDQAATEELNGGPLLVPSDPSQPITIVVRPAGPGGNTVDVTINYVDGDGQPVDTGNGTGTLTNQTPGDPIDYTQITPPDGYEVDQAATEELNGGPLLVPSDPSQPVTIVVTRRPEPGAVPGYINVVYQVIPSGDVLLKETIPGNLGDTGTATVRSFAGYQWVSSDPVSAQATFSQAGLVQTITISYKKNDTAGIITGNVVVMHVDKNNPNNVLAVEQYQGKAGDIVMPVRKQFAGWQPAGSDPTSLTIPLASGAPVPVYYFYYISDTDNNGSGGNDVIVDTHNNNGYAQVSYLVGDSNGLLLGQQLIVYPMPEGQTSLANQQLNANDYTGYTKRAPITQNVTITVRDTLPVEFYYGVNATIQYQDQETGQTVDTGNGTGILNNQTPGDPIDYTQITAPDGYEVDQAATEELNGGPLLVPSDPNQPVTIVVRPIEQGGGKIDVTINYVDENGRPVDVGNGTGILTNQTPGDPIDYGQITAPDGYEVDQAATEQRNGGALKVPTGSDHSVTIVVKSKDQGTPVDLVIVYKDGDTEVGRQTISNLTPGTVLTLDDLTPPVGYVLNEPDGWTLTVPNTPGQEFDVQVTKGENQVLILHFKDRAGQHVAGKYSGVYTFWTGSVVDDVYQYASYPYDAIFGYMHDGDEADYNNDIPSGYMPYPPDNGKITADGFVNGLAQKPVTLTPDKVKITVIFRDKDGKPVGDPQELTLTPGSEYPYSSLNPPTNYKVQDPNGKITVSYDDATEYVTVVYSPPPPGGGGGGGGPGGDTSLQVIYHPNNGSGDANVSETHKANDTVTVKPGSTFTAPEGKVFVGWSDSAGGAVVYNEGDTFTMPNKNVDLYAVWEDAKILALDTENHFAYIVGYPDSTVHPTKDITRAEVATIFFRLLTDDSRKSLWQNTNDYSDVTMGKWFNNAVSTLSNAGVTKGYPDGKFHPDANITRAEFAAMASRFATETPTGSVSFSDISGHWAANEIIRAAQLGWISGYPDGTFRPNQNITRAEAMAIVNRVLNRHVNSVDDLLSDMHKWTDNINVGVWYYFDVQEATNSHDYTRNDDGVNEHWTAMLSDPDWKVMERQDYQP